jgi:glycosyltransferase involved in cell wall biosynthesis
MRSLLTGGEPDAFVLISHGGYADLRMTRELLEALSRLPRRFRLAMTNAQESCPEMDSLLDKFHLAGRIVRLPRTDFLEMLKYTVNADAGVLLYRNNDLGNFFQAPGRFTEHLACGLPLLASDHTGLENLVRRFDLGECVDATRPEDVAAGILRLGQAAKEGRCQRERLRQSFLQHFAFDHWEPLICRAFDDLLSGTGRRETAPPPSKWIPGT